MKSLYAVAFICGCLGVHEATGERAWLDIALDEYRWIESHLLRADGLYWCDFSAGPPSNPEHPRGPVGASRAGRIAVASSVPGRHLHFSAERCACDSRWIVSPCAYSPRI